MLEEVKFPVHEGESNPLGIPEYNLVKPDDDIAVVKAKTEAQKKFYEEHKNQD